MRTDLEAFAREWIEAWNLNDLDRILSHYAEDVVFESPGVVTIIGDPSGRVVGKAALRTYWRKVMDRLPVRRFELRDVLSGANGCAIRYWSSSVNAEVIEVAEFGPDGLVIRGGAYRSRPQVRRS